MQCRIFIERPVGVVHSGENGLQIVAVFLLRNRIELVITAGAMRGHAGERGDCGGHHVVTIQHSCHVLIDGALAQFLMADKIPGRQR